MALELIPYKVVEQTLGSPDRIFNLSEGAQLEVFRWIFNFKFTQLRDFSVTGRRAGQLCSTTHIDCELVIPVDHSASTLETPQNSRIDLTFGENRSHPGCILYFIYLYVMILFFFAFVSFLCVSHHLRARRRSSACHCKFVPRFRSQWKFVRLKWCTDVPLVSFKCQVLWNQRTWEMPCLIPSLMWKLHFHCHRFQKRWDNLVLCRDVGE